MSVDISTIIERIDNEIENRATNRFGIKFSPELYRELQNSGRIALKTFTVSGTGAFPLEFPAYDGNVVAWCDFEMDDYEYEFGDE